MEGNASNPKGEQLTKCAGDAQMLLYEVANVSLTLATCLRFAGDCTHSTDPKFMDGIRSGTAAILEMQQARALAVADALGDLL